MVGTLGQLQCMSKAYFQGFIFALSLPCFFTCVMLGVYSVANNLLKLK